MSTKLQEIIKNHFGGKEEPETVEEPRPVLEELPEASVLSAAVIAELSPDAEGVPDGGMEDEELTYRATCERLGIPTAGIDRVLFRRGVADFMRRNEFAVYDSVAVGDYLNNLCEQIVYDKNKEEGVDRYVARTNTNLFDFMTSTAIAVAPSWLRTSPDNRVNLAPNHHPDVFPDAIPIEALTVADQVRKAWNEQMVDQFPRSVVHFEASQIQFHPDPFMRAVFYYEPYEVTEDMREGESAYFRTHRDLVRETFVIAHWDEPGFKVGG